MVIAADLIAMPVARWQVTRGHVSSAGRVSEPKFRAVIPNSDGETAEVKYTYLGPSDVEERLASGLPRRQVGLKLRAADGCNLVYVMWRIEPKAQLVVSLKRNPGQRTHAECGARGYRNLVARAGTQPAPLAPNMEHRLHAKLDGRILRVWADRALAWEGDVGDEVLALRGPAGVRSDNAKLELELLVHAAAPSGIASAGDDED